MKSGNLDEMTRGWVTQTWTIVLRAVHLPRIKSTETAGRARSAYTITVGRPDGKRKLDLDGDGK